MPHSPSPPDDEPEPVRLGRAALTHPVATYANPDRPWELVTQCAGACKRRARPVADLPPLSPGTTWAEVIPRLRCDAPGCGAAADIVGLSGPPRTPGWGNTWLLLRMGDAAGWR